MHTLLAMLEKQFKNKKVLLLGLGIQGGAQVAQFFAEIGAQVRITDLKPREQLKPSLEILEKYPKITYVLGEHRTEDIEWAEIILRNPGFRRDSPLLKLAQELNKEILMEASLFMKYCPCFMVAVTGTRGKSTTTNMIYETLHAHSGKIVHLGGNIPHRPALPLLLKVKKDDIVVLELSSWQLQGCARERVSPHIAILTNIYPDHLNFYNNMEEYVADKLAIFDCQSDQDATIITKDLEKNPLVMKAIKGQINVISDKDFPYKLTHLIGQHNYTNAAMALKAAELCGVSRHDAATTLCAFRGLPFRIQHLGTVKDSPVFNDSTSTTPIACQTALEALHSEYPDKKITLIMGGNSKNLPFAHLVTSLHSYVHRLYLLNGTFTQEIQPMITNITGSTTIYTNLSDLWQELLTHLTPEDVILFSPSATSFAGFKNEFDRGEQFTQEFNKHRDN